ncbi:Gfo/Idh/MocA family protein [Actinoplanes sp. N902-109]|uniref:Gfo/Idh/MocA family protein n=1 Tax=Actinoplanes sp. (strain N902-109) TaxID=649831 RepID=UPI0003295C66|nr:Gfo/Idh/MocA family oxidoreductase [Actinoplanes sp. N902-109]AGL16401.1 oxidoreductase [Actinoplanes sp. N902-109]
MTLRLALVGFGWAARSIWLPRLQSRPELTVTTVVDPDPAVRALAGAAGIATVLTGLDELSTHDTDLAIVAVPNHAHATVAATLLRRGIPVFLEKPVCLTEAEAEELASAEKEGGAALIAGSAARHRADVLALGALAAEAGTIRHVRLDWVRASGVPGTGWFTRRQLAGGGALLDLGWHLLDVLLALTGPLTFDDVVGTIGHDFVHRRSAQAAWKDDGAPGTPGDVEDTVRGFLATADGLSVALHTSWGSHATCDTTTIELYGDAGTAALTCTFGFSPNRVERPALTFTRDGVTSAVPFPAEPVGAEYDRQVAALAGLLADPDRRGRAVADARWTVRVIERVYASARRGASCEAA